MPRPRLSRVVRAPPQAEAKQSNFLSIYSRLASDPGMLSRQVSFFRGTSATGRHCGSCACDARISYNRVKGEMEMSTPLPAGSRQLV